MKNHVGAPKRKDPCTSRDPLSSMITNALEDPLPSMLTNTAYKHRLVGSAFNEKGSTFIHDNQCLRIRHIVPEL
jgi:hypothetical protein